METTECHFTPRTDATSTTICANCGKEKMLHINSDGFNWYSNKELFVLAMIHISKKNKK